MANGTSAEAASLKASALERIAARQCTIVELIGFAEALMASGDAQGVLTLYKAWIAHNPDSPFLYAAYFNYGVSLSGQGDAMGAIGVLRDGIRVKPDFYPPYINLGNLLEGIGRPDQAYAEWMALVNLLPQVNGDTITHKNLALKQTGRLLESRNSDATAESVLKQALELNPDQSDVIQHWIALRMRQCRWPVMTATAQLGKPRLMSAISPLSIAAFADDPMFQLATAHHYNRTSIGFPATARPAAADVTPATRRPGRLRIGYVSSDLREHAVGFAMAEVAELHDRREFEVFAYYCGIPREDGIKARIRAGVEHWTDISVMSDTEAAEAIRRDGIDILVDLNGYTKDARTKVFSLRPTPIAVNWFGFPGTMGSAYHHYIVADLHIIPLSHERYYSEEVVRLPCYQPNDRKRVIAARRPTRAAAGLPEDAFVYCCLNGSQKLTAITFERWMTILKAVPDSVLWLLSAAPDTDAHLRTLAGGRGVAPERLVFAGKQANPEHLARYPLADLFLDNFPYGAHTTAADALWMGVPILTLPGRSFASRVCMSVVRAAGLDDMVCADADAYVARAVAFGQDRARLAPIRERLTANRGTCLLFDTPGLVRNLEEAYKGMWRDFAEGRLPRPDLKNLDLYHEIGAGLDGDTVELMSDASYAALYREKLAIRDSYAPVAPDQRFWPG